jgi:excisionase family DNA binding protein
MTVQSKRRQPQQTGAVPRPVDPDRMLTREETATYLDVSLTVVDALVTEHQLTAYRVGGTFVRFRSEDVMAYRDQQLGQHGLSMIPEGALLGWSERVREFMYLHGFYLLAGALALVLLSIVWHFS